MAQNPHIPSLRPGATSHSVQPDEEAVPHARGRVQEAGLADCVRRL